MLYKNLFDEVIPIFQSLSPFNMERKLDELFNLTVFTEKKIHLQLFKEYLNDNEIYRNKIEPFSHFSYIDNSNTSGITISFNPIFIFNSIEFFMFDKILSDCEKKELVLKYLKILDIDSDGNVEKTNYFEAQQLLSNIRLYYHEQILDLESDNLKNLAVINEVINIANNYKIGLTVTDEPTQKLIEHPLKFFKEKKEYFKEAYFIQTESNKGLSDDIPKLPFNFKNNFDHVEEIKIYQYFKEQLVDKNYLSSDNLEKYILMAFQNNEIPNIKFSFSNSNIERIRTIFYKYFKDIAGKPHGKKTKYAELLGEYFIGFTTQKVSNNFADGYKIIRN